MIYAYSCKGCGHRWDVTKRLAEIDRVEPCPECKSEDSMRVPHTSGFTTSESLGRVKAPSEFRDFLKVIHKNTPGSKMELD